MDNSKNNLRNIPSVDKLIGELRKNEELTTLPHSLFLKCVQETTEAARQNIIAGLDEEISTQVLLMKIKSRLVKLVKPSLKRVINATGVVLHTNLGRAPLSKRSIERVVEIAGGYSNLEYLIDSGERGSRYSHIAAKIAALTGAEDAIVVNNNAAAVMLALSALSYGQEVIVSRGQLVEIGGSFRIPDVLKQSGAKLVEVGTTNKTHLRDYANAISENTAAILKVHTSNYRIIGFTSEPDNKELVELAAKSNLPVIEDLGSGTINPITAGQWDEPSVAEVIKDGVDIVTFSGDKLLGAGQAGIIAGKKEYISIMKKHPLMRAIRVDKLSLAALEGTLIDYISGNPKTDVPVQSMLCTSREELEGKATRLSSMLSGLSEFWWQSNIVETDSQAGGGAMPEMGFTSYGVSLKAAEVSTATLERHLRNWTIPIITRVQSDRVIIDVRCLTEQDMTVIKEACLALAKGRGI
ncbi:L-seryl-tRNA(Sec) selenium transferase [Dendrosporobacter sp. 1207_IL3150]|uniref:L-seryl-tRNA(Sec) selenium transferase n=1 Tax=Dendrosporobacter sp. 1207_IL3150 TaxID=3084054 RepID=UPI002FDB2116